jgi:hypothetical protein
MFQWSHLMQISALLEAAEGEHLPPLQRKVLAYLDAHPDEVFSYRDEKLAAELGAKPSGIGFSLWTLRKAGLIDKETVAGKVYFGSSEAMRRLKRGLGRGQDDAFERMIANAERIRARVGNINTLAILDELRSHNELA